MANKTKTNVKKEETVEPTEENTKEPVSHKTHLGGPRPISGYGPMPCTVELPRNILQSAGLWPGNPVEITCPEPGIITIRKVGDNAPKPEMSSRPARSFHFETPEEAAARENRVDSWESIPRRS